MAKLYSKKFLIGYMPSFSADLLEEIKFAKKYFDFVEITLKRGLSQYNRKYLKQVKDILDEFKILGHIHWETDLKNPNEMPYIFENINIFEYLGAKKITIHPSSDKHLDPEKIKAKNSEALRKIYSIYKKRGIQLLVENTISPPFNNPQGLKYLLNDNSKLGITFDIGHANIKNRDGFEKYIKSFASEIKHIHLHYCTKQKDHLPFSNRSGLCKILAKLRDLSEADTITLEIFNTIEKNRAVPIRGDKRRKIILGQLKMIKKWVS